MTVATSTITFVHDGVFVTANGRIKIAASPRKFWRIWIYHEPTDTWQIQYQVFKHFQDAKSAAALAEREISA